MTKAELKKELKLIIEQYGLDFIEGNKSLKEQWGDREETPENLYDFFNLDTSMENIDPRRFSTYMQQVKQTNPQTPLFDLYNQYKGGNIDYSGAKNIYPHEMFGVNEDSFYNPNDSQYWANVMKPYYLGDTREKDYSKGLFKVLNDQDMTQQELLKLITEEEIKRKRERAADLSLKENYDGLGSGDGILDRGWRKLNQASANHFWGNTLRDIREGTADGLNPVDVASTIGEIAVSSIPGGSLGRNVAGYASELAMPFAKELGRSQYYGEDYELGNASKDAISNAGGRFVANGLAKPFESAKKVPFADDAFKKSVDVFQESHPTITKGLNIFGRDIDPIAKEVKKISTGNNEVDPKTLGDSVEDYEKAAVVYNNLMNEKPEAVANASMYRGGGKDLTDTERDWIDKYLMLNLKYGKR